MTAGDIANDAKTSLEALILFDRSFDLSHDLEDDDDGEAVEAEAGEAGESWALACENFSIAFAPPIEDLRRSFAKLLLSLLPPGLEVDVDRLSGDEGERMMSHCRPCCVSPVVTCV